MLPLRQNVEINYPVCTHVDAQKLEFRPRVLRAYKIRDLVTDPLTIREYLARPFIRRGRYLALCKDLRSGELRQFYVASTQEHWRQTPLRFCLFDPAAKKPIEIMPSCYGTSTRDRLILSKTLLNFLDAEFEGDLRIGIYCDDLQVIG